MNHSILKPVLACVAVLGFFPPSAGITFTAVPGSQTGLAAILQTWHAESNSSNWWPWGVSLIDYNRDGKWDLIITTHGADGGLILKNVSTGSTLSWQRVNEAMGLPPKQIMGGDGKPVCWDFDGDGWVDIPGFSNEYSYPSLWNDKGTLTKAAFSLNPMVYFQSADLNNDGYIDQWGCSEAVGHAAFVKIYDPAKRTFKDDSASKYPATVHCGQPTYALPAEWVHIADSIRNIDPRQIREEYVEKYDFNNDGIIDVLGRIYESYYDQYMVEGYFLRDAKGNLTDATASLGFPRAGYPDGFYDFNQDGRIDILVRKGTAPGVYLSKAGGGYVCSPLPTLWRYWSLIAIVDFDNDGDKDLLDGSGDPYNLFENLGGGNFRQTSFQLTGGWRDDGLEVCDINHDGKLDIIHGNGDDITIFLNTTPNTGNYAFLYPKMDGTHNPYAVGAKLEIFAAGQAGVSGAVPFSTEDANSNGLPVHVGLGSATKFDVKVTWPGQAKPEIFVNRAAADSVALVKGAGNVPVKTAFSKNERFSIEARPNPLNPAMAISFDIQSAHELPVRLMIYNPTGRCVAVQTNCLMSEGRQSIRWNAIGAPSGAYVARLTAGAQEMSKKILHLN